MPSAERQFSAVKVDELLSGRSEEHFVVSRCERAVGSGAPESQARECGIDGVNVRAERHYVDILRAHSRRRIEDPQFEVARCGRGVVIGQQDAADIEGEIQRDQSEVLPKPMLELVSMSTFVVPLGSTYK